MQGAAKRRRQRSRQSIGGEDRSDVGPVPASSLKDDLDDDVGFDEDFDADSQSDVRLPAARKWQLFCLMGLLSILLMVLPLLLNLQHRTASV